jgi:hypothetical protein
MELSQFKGSIKESAGNEALFSGVHLGDAMKLARMTIQNKPGDPT